MKFLLDTLKSEFFTILTLSASLGLALGLFTGFFKFGGVFVGAMILTILIGLVAVAVSKGWTQ